MSTTNPLDFDTSHLQAQPDPGFLPPSHPYAPYADYAEAAPAMLSPDDNTRKRRLSEDEANDVTLQLGMSNDSANASIFGKQESPLLRNLDFEAAMQGQSLPAQMQQPPMLPPQKKNRVNTPWTPAEEQRLKQLRDLGQTWNEIAKSFPNRTEGSVKKHWYKDMHYAEFAQDESAALLHAIRDYETSKWKVIGQRVGKPAKACEQYAKENFTKDEIAGKAKDKEKPSPDQDPNAIIHVSTDA